jgi:hypothetical protein
VSDRPAPRRFTLEEIASTDAIARWAQANALHVAVLRATLATITPDTVVTDDGGEPRTMSALANEHRSTAHHSDHHPMSEEQAWEWAVRDLVFGGFRPVTPPEQSLAVTFERRSKAQQRCWNALAAYRPMQRFHTLAAWMSIEDLERLALSWEGG